MLLIAVVALLVLGPKKLPELARGIGKFVREFRRQTDDVRGVVEREFYRMDHEEENAAPKIAPVSEAVSQGSLGEGTAPTIAPAPTDALPVSNEPPTLSQVTSGMPRLTEPAPDSLPDSTGPTPDASPTSNQKP
jgi:sec-independent protein translocase protein TatB